MNTLEIIRLIALAELSIEGSISNAGKETLKSLLAKLEIALKDGAKLQ